MKKLVDVVNFNADASCMSSNKWLKSLENGEKSRFCKLLDNYIKNERKVNLGLTGVTIKDLAAFNTEAIVKINAHPEIFEILYRTYSHDLSPLRNNKGFRLNLDFGLETIRKHFKNTVNVFLQSEIMIRNRQIETLRDNEINAIFINPERYNDDVQRLIPKAPFICHGTGDSEILTIPFADNLTLKYLDNLHRNVHHSTWTNLINNSDLTILWRDGESSLLFPGGIEFEGILFKYEKSQGVKRRFLSEKLSDFKQQANAIRGSQLIKHFPQHQLDHWLSDFKMIWLLEHLNQIERIIDKQTPILQKLWLLAIDSDIPASSEKKSIEIKVHPDVFKVPRDDIAWDGVIPCEKDSVLRLLRSERFFEGEEYLRLFDLLINNELSESDFITLTEKSSEPHIRKVFSRVIL